MTEDLFRHRLEHMIDTRHPIVQLSRLLAWKDIEKRLSEILGRDVEGKKEGIDKGGRPRIAIRRLIALLYCKYYYNLSDEAVVERWSQDLYMQYLSGEEHFQPCLPYDATQLGRFRQALGEAGAEELLPITIEAARRAGAIKKSSNDTGVER